MFVSVAPRGFTVFLVSLGSIADKILPTAYDKSHRYRKDHRSYVSHDWAVALQSLCLVLLVSIGTHWDYIFPVKKKAKI